MSTAVAHNTKERPILFSGPMVRAIIAGEKTQTRRVVKPQPPEGWSPIGCERYHPAIEDEDGMIGAAKKEIFGAYDEEWGVACPYGGPGDRLWVREAFYDRADYAAIGKLRRDRFVYHIRNYRGPNPSSE